MWSWLVVARHAFLRTRTSCCGHWFLQLWHQSQSTGEISEFYFVFSGKHLNKRFTWEFGKMNKWITKCFFSEVKAGTFQVLQMTAPPVIYYRWWFLFFFFLTLWFYQLFHPVPGFKKHSIRKNPAEYSTFCLSESLSVSVRTKPPTFFFFFLQSLPVQCHVPTSRLKKSNDELLTPETNPAAFEDIRSYLVFLNTSFTLQDTETSNRGHWPQCLTG